MTNQGTKRSKSYRICEYFNEEVAEIYPQKTGSDYTRHPNHTHTASLQFYRSIIISQNLLQSSYKLRPKPDFFTYNTTK